MELKHRRASVLTLPASQFVCCCYASAFWRRKMFFLRTNVVREKERSDNMSVFLVSFWGKINFLVPFGDYLSHFNFIVFPKTFFAWDILNFFFVARFIIYITQSSWGFKAAGRYRKDNLFLCSLSCLYFPVCGQGTFGKKCRDGCHCIPGVRCHPVSGRCICPKGRHGDKCDEGAPQPPFGLFSVIFFAVDWAWPVF